jgi:hypothetical protein
MKHEIRLSTAFDSPDEAELWMRCVRGGYNRKGINLSVSRGAVVKSKWYVWRTSTSRDYTEPTMVARFSAGDRPNVTVIQYCLDDTTKHHEPILREAK